MLASAMWSLPAAATAVPGQGTWESTLQGRDLDGNLATFEAWYDTVLGITWLADANYALTSGYDTQGHVDGRLSWDLANEWAAGLDPYDSGIVGWRLPTAADLGSAGCDFSYNGTDCGYNSDTSASEMAFMFYVTLGNLAYYDILGQAPQEGWGLTNTGPFLNLMADGYYLTGSAVGEEAWGFLFRNGRQRPRPIDDTVPDTNRYFSWVVRDGDIVAPVPLPAAAWLLLSGLAGLTLVARRRAAA